MVRVTIIGTRPPLTRMARYVYRNALKKDVHAGSYKKLKSKVREMFLKQRAKHMVHALWGAIKKMQKNIVAAKVLGLAAPCQAHFHKRLVRTISINVTRHAAGVWIVYWTAAEIEDNYSVTKPLQDCV